MQLILIIRDVFLAYKAHKVDTSPNSWHLFSLVTLWNLHDERLVTLFIGYLYIRSVNREMCQLTKECKIYLWHLMLVYTSLRYIVLGGENFNISICLENNISFIKLSKKASWASLFLKVFMDSNINRWLQRSCKVAQYSVFPVLKVLKAIVSFRMILVASSWYRHTPPVSPHTPWTDESLPRLSCYGWICDAIFIQFILSAFMLSTYVLCFYYLTFYSTKMNKNHCCVKQTWYDPVFER